MVKLSKESREKRRFLILQMLSEKTIAEISKEIDCETSTVFRTKKS